MDHLSEFIAFVISLTTEGRIILKCNIQYFYVANVIGLVLEQLIKNACK